ncbi:MAG: guanylate kinase [Thermosediminibacterales bacterium]|nr:guanylate kinase [Thermosediminibacterales bacterium]MDK2836067.1 guanylate kinase [Thermosediminibacterales bacterium]
MRQKEGLLVVISGPSGAGKGTLCERLLKKNHSIYKSVSMTTRQPRKGEIDGESYYFITEEEFKNKIKNGEFLEWAKVYGNYYGSPRAKVLEKLRQGMDVLLEIDIQGAIQVKKSFSDGVFIFILPPSFEELSERIKKRATEDEKTIYLRLKSAYEEIKHALEYDYIIVNDDIQDAVDKLEAIIKAEKCRAKRNKTLLLTEIGGEETCCTRL